MFVIRFFPFEYFVNTTTQASHYRPLAAKFTYIPKSHCVRLLGQWSLENVRRTRDPHTLQILYGGCQIRSILYNIEDSGDHYKGQKQYTGEHFTAFHRGVIGA